MLGVGEQLGQLTMTVAPKTLGTHSHHYSVYPLARGWGHRVTWFVHLGSCQTAKVQGWRFITVEGFGDPSRK